MWTPLITHAFEQWEQAVPDRITVTHISGSCTVTFDDNTVHAIDNNVPLTLVRALFNGSNEVYMVDTSDWRSRLLPFVAGNRLFACVQGVPIIRNGGACVISTRYTDSRPGIFALDEGSVDVLVNARRQRFDRDIPGGDVYVHTLDTRFNTCKVGTADDNDFFNYETMVHEAGHALGLSGYNPVLWVSRLTAHPSIPDSVMNYNSEVSRETVPEDFDEPDCSPHPFDIMAIQALYQLTP